MSVEPIWVLVVDDEAYTRDLFANLLEGDEYEVVPAGGGREALEMFRSGRFDVVLLDLKMSGMNGLEVLERLRRIDDDVSVLIMTGHGTIDSAVEAMKLGAEDYLTKPFENIDELKMLLEKVVRYRRLREENRRLRLQLRPGNIVGNSRKMRDVFRLIEKVAPLASTILISGESGTGKELVARTIHDMSPRWGRRFVAVNCGGLPETLLESTLFGYERGAFTGALRTTRGYFEAAAGGTLFLDEIGETSPSLQVRLLRVLQERSFERVGGTSPVRTDIRIIAATNADLSRRVIDGTFREDLYYRINVIQVALPPLRDRREDIPLLATHFLKKYGGEFGKEIASFSREAVEAMIAYRWPGNVRELENVVERAVALEEGGVVRRMNLPPALAGRDAHALVPSNGLRYREAKRAFERGYIVEALKRARGNVSKAARESGLARQNFHKKILEYGVDIRKLRDGSG